MLGGCLAGQNRYAEAEPLFHEALRLERKLLTNDDVRVAETLTALSSLMWKTRRLTEAERLDREALAMYQRLDTNQTPELATVLNNLGTVLRGTGIAWFDDVQLIKLADDSP